MERCMRCSRSDVEVRLFDGFYVNEPVRICEKCSILSNIPIVKRPSAAQLKVSERAVFDVRKRLAVLAGLDNEVKKEKTLSEELRQFADNPQIEKPEDLVFKLVDNFHWVIQTERRRKGYTSKQLADIIGESESAIKMLEKGIVPNNSLELIQKIEQFLKIKLVKKDYYDKILNESIRSGSFSGKPTVPVSKPVILQNPNENPLGFGIKNKLSREQEIRKEEAEDMVKQAIMTEKNTDILSREKIESTPLRIESFRRDKLQGINIADLKRMEDNAEKSFELENLKTRAELGREQVEDFGRENTAELKRKVYGSESRFNASSSVNEKLKSGKTPSIYELMKIREEQNKKARGKEIVLENKEFEPGKANNAVIEESEAREEERKKGIISNLKEIFGFGKKKDRLDIDLETGKFSE